MIQPTTPRAWANTLAKAWGPHFPVDVRQIALEYTKQRFRADPIAKIAEAEVETFEGALYLRPQKNCWYILYNPRIESSGRINFTIAHELGHYLLHRSLAQSFECNQRDLIDYGGKDSLKREEEANIFASYLLMPLNDFREQVGHEPATLDLLSYCADRYQVSLTAAALKWLEFTDERAVLVVARDEFILWARSSKSALRSGVFFRKGAPLPAGSLALAQFQGQTNLRDAVLSEGVWVANEAVREMAISSDRYDLTISLLTLGRTSTVSFHEDEKIEDLADDISRLFP